MILHSSVFGTHNRAGEIIYKRITGHQFEITIVTFTEINNNNADRDTLELFFGDGHSRKVIRTKKQAAYNGHTNIQRNEYKTTYTYPGPGQYKLSMIDPNRNGGIINIPNSIERKFYIESFINISLSASNNSVILTRDPIAFACNNSPFYYNPGAYDPDLDSLRFQMVACKADNGLPIPDYTFPAASNVFKIDPVTGILTWDSPTTAGEYNVAILISEWRRYNDGRKDTARLVGYLLRDMQITVYSNCSNKPPEISPVSDYCVTAEEELDFKVFASDRHDGSSANNGARVTLNAYGGPMEEAPVATFTTSGTDSVVGSFHWKTACYHVKKNAYTLTFEAIDDGIPSLSNYTVSSIRVVAPRVENPTAQAQSSSIHLTWEKEHCPLALGYRIYRKSGPTGFVPDSCQTGVPAELGYKLIYQGSDNNEISYTDDNFTQGLIPGVIYCYLIIAYFADGAESYASEEICAKLKKDVPILTNIDVEETDLSEGIINLAWSKPNEHDIIVYPGPYKYRILRCINRQFSNFAIIDSTTGIDDTSYTDNGLNTLEEEYSYKIEMLDMSQGSDRSMGYSVIGTSVYLSSLPKDNKLILKWNELVPWENEYYVVYKKNAAGNFDSIGTTTEKIFADSMLTNLKTYCYSITSFGAYSLSSIANPLINRSQIHCNKPVDLQAPCPPVLSIRTDDCAYVESYLGERDQRCNSDDSDAASEVEKTELTWTNPNLSCDTTDDVDSILLYFSPTKGGNFRLLHVELINKEAGTVQPTSYNFTHQMKNTMAGCYYTTAVDSFGNVSAQSNTVCSDNCLIYRLPNVFTPNGDGINDYFEPFPYCYVKEIELKVFNRWGNTVFETDNAEVLWNGINSISGIACPDGVYYYTCIVHHITVEGIRKTEIKGNVHILGSGKAPSD